MYDELCSKEVNGCITVTQLIFYLKINYELLYCSFFCYSTAVKQNGMLKSVKLSYGGSQISCSAARSFLTHFLYANA